MICGLFVNFKENSEFTGKTEVCLPAPKASALPLRYSPTYSDKLGIYRLNRGVTSNYSTRSCCTLPHQNTSKSRHHLWTICEDAQGHGGLSIV